MYRLQLVTESIFLRSCLAVLEDVAGHPSTSNDSDSSREPLAKEQILSLQRWDAFHRQYETNVSSCKLLNKS